MKKTLFVFLYLSASGFLFAQKTISIEAEGNLESPHPLGCVDLGEVSPINNPADILHGMGACIASKEYEKAVKLFAIAGVYGTFDTYRVADKTAHQALLVLQQNLLMDIDEEAKTQLMALMNKGFTPGSETLQSLCEAIQKVGMPNYYPKYMVQHGIQAFMEREGNGLVEPFDSEASWRLALETYLHCGSH